MPAPQETTHAPATPRHSLLAGAIGVTLIVSVLAGVWWQSQRLPTPNTEQPQGGPAGREVATTTEEASPSNSNAGSEKSKQEEPGSVEREATSPPSEDTELSGKAESDAESEERSVLDETALWPADHPEVAALLDAAGAGDARALLRKLARYEEAPVEASWHVFASALAASSQPQQRATLVALLAGEDPAARWLAEEPIFAEATGRLYTRLLLEHPEWMREAHAEAGFASRAARMMLEGANPLAEVATPAALTDLLAAGQLAEHGTIDIALLDYLGRCVRHWGNAELASQELETLVAAVTDREQTARGEPEHHAAALRALTLLDAHAGNEALVRNLEQAASEPAAAHAALQAISDLIADGSWSNDPAEQDLPTAVAEMLVQLAAPEPGERNSAAWELSTAGLETVATLLAEEASASLPGALHREMLDRVETVALHSKEVLPAVWHEQALELLLAERGSEPGWEHRLATLAESERASEAELAVRMLARLEAPGATEVLRGLGDDGGHPVRTRLAAMQALVTREVGGEARTGAGRSRLTEQTADLLLTTAKGKADGQDPRLRSRAARLLGEHGGERVPTESLQALAQEDPEPSVRAAAIRGLAAGCPPERRAQLMRWLEQRARHDASSHVRNAAHRARATLAAGSQGE